MGVYHRQNAYVTLKVTMQTNILTVALLLFAAAIVVEYLIYTTQLGWRFKNQLALFCLVASAFSIGCLLPLAFSAAAVLVTLLMVYRSVNLLRLVEARMHEQYLRRATKRTYYWLAGAQLLSIGLWFVFAYIPSSIAGSQALLAVSVSLAAGGICIFLYSAWSIIKTRAGARVPLSDKELPTLTLAIAARNENDDLTQCLTAALASNYPKLEIIVLDDCSQDHTPDIIKSFAHDGVRFVQGDEPSSTWLAKNAAYQKLLDESSGELILYMGVDVRLHPDSLRSLVETFMAKRVAMMSILPKRTKSGLLAVFIQPMRYWWELALPRFIIKHEPVLSTTWVAWRQSLIKMGGFKSVMRAITPEEHMSTVLHKMGGYAFVRTNQDLNITTHKNFHSQWLTAVRTRYPQMHRRPELTAFRVLIMLYFLITPFVLLPLLLVAHNVSSVAIVCVAIGVMGLIGSHILISLVTNPIAALLAPINFPIVVIVDFIALHISMYRYEFGEVIWKGRDVTTPAMHVIPHLPEL